MAEHRILPLGFECPKGVLDMGNKEYYLAVVSKPDDSASNEQEPSSRVAQKELFDKCLFE